MILNSPIKQIDHVLQILRNHQSVLYFDDLNKKIKESSIIVEPSVLRIILEKLVIYFYNREYSKYSLLRLSPKLSLYTNLL